VVLNHPTDRIPLAADELHPVEAGQVASDEAGQAASGKVGQQEQLLEAIEQPGGSVVFVVDDEPGIIRLCERLLDQQASRYFAYTDPQIMLSALRSVTPTCCW
jgi:PleD family two-component response regulator